MAYLGGEGATDLRVLDTPLVVCLFRRTLEHQRIVSTGVKSLAIRAPVAVVMHASRELHTAISAGIIHCDVCSRSKVANVCGLLLLRPQDDCSVAFDDRLLVVLATQFLLNPSKVKVTLNLGEKTG